MMNQCDGCRVSAPLTERGHHKMPDGGYLGCTKDRYGDNDMPEKIYADRYGSPPYTEERWWHAEPSGSYAIEGIHEYIRADLVPQWQPIETAPKDKVITVWWPTQYHHPLIAYFSTKYDHHYGWNVSGWNHERFKTEPTHWMPLPKVEK